MILDILEPEYNKTFDHTMYDFSKKEYTTEQQIERYSKAIKLLFEIEEKYEIDVDLFLNGLYDRMYNMFPMEIINEIIKRVN